MVDLKSSYRTVMDDRFPDDLTIDFGGQKLVYRKRAWTLDDGGKPVRKGLRYGENPGQEAALYELVSGNLALGGCSFIGPGRGLVSCLSEEGLAQFGKHPGKTNLTDLDNALNIMRHLADRPACAIMKHNNPSGVAYGADARDAYERANAGDRLAAFGGCAVLSVRVDGDAARAMAENYLELVAAPDFTGEALAIFKAKKNLRVVRIADIARIRDYAPLRFVDFKSLIDGGLIVQQSPANRIRTADDFLPAEAVRKDGTRVRVVRAPAPQELEDLLFAWQVEQGVTSNSVLFAKNGATVAVGAGEQDRVGVAEIAVLKAYKKYADNLCFARHGCLLFELKAKAAKGGVPASAAEEIQRETAEARGGLIGAAAASDAFFPKRDGIDVILAEGASAVAQPGGSLADAEIIDAVNDAGAAMVFTGQRAFKH